MDSSRTTNHQLAHLAKRYGIPLNDICSKDHLNLNEPSPGGYIVNMQDSNDGNGTHWVALWLERISGKHMACYFDSFGIDPPLDVINFCCRFGAKKIISSTKEIQNINGGHCGQYCIDFLRHMTYSCSCSMRPRAHALSRPSNGTKREQKYRNFIDHYNSYSKLKN